MMLFRLALRNILRNRRRSLGTGSAIAIGALALLTFGGFQGYIFKNFETSLVQRDGHLAVFRDGYFLFGSGNPAAYGIENYDKVSKLIAEDAVIAPHLRVITPTVALMGIAGNFTGGMNTAKTFFGTGVVPADRTKMQSWAGRGVGMGFPPNPLLAQDDPKRGYVGVGMARVLGLCAPLKVADCPAPPVAAATGAAREDFADLAKDDLPKERQVDALPHIDLLAATAAGTPNVVSLSVAGVRHQGVREIDDIFVGLHFTLAQQLLYGRGEAKTTSLVLQLHRTEDVPLVRARLADIFAANGLKLEARDYVELNSFYAQVRSFFGSLFLFIAIIMGMIVLFTVVNTMSMAVMERTSEIGTIRAMGLRRGGVRRQFLLEGALLGAIGTTVGLVASLIVAVLVNGAGITWTPPGNSAPVPLQLDVAGAPVLIAATWIGLVVIATIAAFLPANRAAKLQIVDALRHA